MCLDLQCQASLLKATEQQVRLAAQARDCQTDLIGQLVQVRTANVAQLHILEQVPHAFLGIELGCIGRQGFEVDQACPSPGEETVDFLAAMDRSAVPQYEQAAAQ